MRWPWSALPWDVSADRYRARSEQTRTDRDPLRGDSTLGRRTQRAPFQEFDRQLATLGSIGSAIRVPSATSSLSCPASYF